MTANRHSIFYGVDLWTVLLYVLIVLAGWVSITSASYDEGTAENPRGRDHSTFLSFAPKDNPKIAISVYVENGGFGASAALPIASLLEEYYLTDTIRRPAMLEYVKNLNIYYPAYDK